MSAGAGPWVLHVDLDEFLAAVEVLRRPELAGTPVVVGGRGDPTERGVVATASYAARELGVRSGMPLRTALRKAPEATFLPADHQAYEEASASVMATLRGLEGVVVEVLGWDEAFLGAVTDDPEGVAQHARSEVLAATDLHCSVGIGDNKVRAKIATGFGKPRGIFRLTDQNWSTVMGDRPVVDLWGVGPRVSRRLAGHGVRTVSELARAPVEVLTQEFGPRMGRWYHELGSGLGPSVVDDSPWVARGHSRERTFQENLTSPEAVDEAVRDLATQAFADTAQEGRAVVRVTLKVRYAPFFTKIYGRRLPAPTTERDDVVAAALALTERLEAGREVRLLGVHAEMVMPDGPGRADRTPVRGRI
ncbi:DNA polymerase IV [Ornithinimicrobium sp. W1679]|uniref:DNA polymerase IV n=1 Tax=Ornithinimicrobium sp. W1679 TaxID=3418770 RepID=UPI003CF71109